MRRLPRCCTASSRSRRANCRWRRRCAASPPICRRSNALPPRDIAAVDGFALRARDLVGASSYSPLPLTRLAGLGRSRRSPCPRAATACSIPIPSSSQVRCRRCWRRRSRGRAFAAPAAILPREAASLMPGGASCARDLLIARAAGLAAIAACAGRGCASSIFPAARVTADLIAESARAAGADVVCVDAAGRDAASIAAALDADACDLLLIVGGSGVGRTDATVKALAERGEVSPMASRCSPAAPRRSAASARRRWSCCRARRIRRLRRGGRWRCRCSIGCRAAGRARRSICRWRARSPPASASPRSCCWSGSRAPG